MLQWRRRSFSPRRRFGLGRRRQRLEWFGSIGQLVTSSATPGAAAELIPNSKISTMTRPTLMRTHGTIVTAFDQPPTAAETWGITFGAQLIPVAVSLDTMEFPFDDTESDRWLFHHETAFMHGTTGGFEDTTQAERFIVDNRARRVCSETDKLVLRVQTVHVGGASSGQFISVFNLRFLLRETLG